MQPLKYFPELIGIASFVGVSYLRKKYSTQEEEEKVVEKQEENIVKCPYIDGPLQTPYTMKFRNHHFRKFFMPLPKLCKLNIALNKKLVLLGITGVGKTQIFQKSVGLSISSTSTTAIQIGARRWNSLIVDTPPFTIDTEVEQREQFIGQMQLFFTENKYQIGGLIMVVNFERTDLMKKKITDVYKYIRRFAEHNISIIITDWHLSEQKEQDETTLRNTFRIYRPKFIHFVTNDIKPEDMNNILDDIEGLQCHCSQLSCSSQKTASDEAELNQDILLRFQLCNEFKLQDTIFEIQEDNPEFMEKLNQLASAISKQR